ncbi:helix-turn-helix domain-containing protein [Rhizobium leguminosarum]|nr:IclR family transcriptional regulator [Rhizobium ruizarguesonis]NEI97906.1 helix-turn-helix domain-containing protein [Rhizobium ruizarguesonis]NEJ34445.1 helix-turn-helix domain-containing protein [Rhizobium ruizarguesonis]
MTQWLNNGEFYVLDIEPERDAAFATTLAKGLAVLEAFRPDQISMSNLDIARSSGINRPTVARLTYTLEKLGYLKQEKSKYRLSWRALMLVNPLLANLKLLHIARPSMQKLAEDLGGTVSIGTIDGTNFVYLETARVNENIWSSQDLGTAGPLLPTTVGHSLCAQLSEPELAAKLSEMESASPELWEKYSQSFIQGIESCRNRGFSVARGVWIPGTHSAGAPILRDNNFECFAIGCRVPVYRLSLNQIEDEVGPRLKSLADSIRSQLKYIMTAV